MSDVRRTLLFLINDTKILLAMKKRGFGAGLWNGVGGKLEPGETLEEAVVRECHEEICVTPTAYHKVAELDFYGGSVEEGWHMFVHAYVCTAWEGEPQETEEMAPKWFEKSSIPYEQMWQDDQYWLPLVLDGKSLTGTFTFDANDTLLTHELTESTSL